MLQRELPLFSITPTVQESLIYHGETEVNKQSVLHGDLFALCGHRVIICRQSNRSR